MAELHDYLAETTFEDLPHEVVEHAKLSFLDTIGCIIAAAPAEHVEKLTAFVESFEEKEEATIVARDARATSSHAAMVNGAMAYTVELDDVSPAHPGSAVVPAALAVSEAEGAAGRELIAGIALGYEAIARIYRSAPETPENPYPVSFPNVRFDEVPIHKSSVIGAFGAAAAVGTVKGLDTPGIEDAFGNCAIAPVAPFEACSSGGMVKPLSDAGFPSHTGTLAAQLAARGFTGVDDILRADQGILRILLGEEFDYDRITEDIGDRWLAQEYVSRKRHACCSGGHTPADIVLELVADHDITPESVERATVWVSEFAHSMMGTGDRTEPDDETEAKFSLPFVIATAISTGEVLGLDDFTEERIEDEDLLALAKRVEIVEDRSLESLEATVEIETDPETYTGSKEAFRGRYTNPLSETELRGKFRRLAAREYDDERVERIVAAVDDLEELDDVTELGTLLA